ncbi:MAG TPA: 16S rRNA (guanine(966)-N(2))-methyltransferase RsmD [Anaerolineae bacterium]|nr:16S rRNA (guanine(966)-N(2))-methyltransferase RsmD [Anaerolineae bacterium]HIQ05597.1 16S rRNA (guanine(966)-N(2))-methyltransferase RsmD [Anaerolineae bacterium]
MRVISGRAKGRKLLSVPGEATRPITDRVKEALFNILAVDVPGCRFLDLFGGTGAVGIEALSRGAAEAVFCEIDHRALRTLRENLRRTGLADQAQVIAGDAFAYLKRRDLAPFDIIYVAPPQYRRLWKRALRQIDTRPELLAPGGQVIVQIHPVEESNVPLSSLHLYDRRKYGSTLLLFYKPRPQPELPHGQSRRTT